MQKNQEFGGSDPQTPRRGDGYVLSSDSSNVQEDYGNSDSL